MASVARRIVPGIVSALVVWTVLAALSATTFGRRLELLGFDALTVATAPADFEPPIVIVGIDEPSFAEVDRQWPWPRAMHADLIDGLKAAGAAVIAFDVLFAEPTDKPNDERLADSIRRAGNVVLASDLIVKELDQFQMAVEVEPVPLFRQAGADSGLASIAVDPDLVVRAVPLHPNAFWRQVMQVYSRANKLSPYQPGTLIRYMRNPLRYVSYYQAMAPDEYLPKEIFKGKIVLVGQDIKVSLGQGAARGDAYPTPFAALTGQLTPGVEIQATLVANALAGSGLREAPVGFSWGLTALALLFVVFAAPAGQALRSAMTAVAIVAAIAGLSVWLFVCQHLWLPAVLSISAVAAMYVVQVGVAFLHERNTRRQIEKAFRHYVAPEIVERMTAHPELLVLGGARQKVTLMFTDLADFTSVSENLGPEQVAALLNDYLTHMTRIVLSHGGTVDKFIGDAIMAFWGAPVADDDQALHACRAARDMLQELAVLRPIYRARGLPELRMRIGIHSGDAVVGNMGSADRFDYTAIGDNVNLAARLEGINKLYGTEVLISKPTAQQLDGRMPLRPIDRVIVKGKTQAIDIYTLCDDEETVKISEQALALYMRRQWDQSAACWQLLLQRNAPDLVADVFLRRIEKLRATPPSADWDGSIALEKL